MDVYNYKYLIIYTELNLTCTCTYLILFACDCSLTSFKNVLVPVVYRKILQYNHNVTFIKMISRLNGELCVFALVVLNSGTCDARTNECNVSKMFT